ncbi:FtsX-like permease family protein [Cryobacterium tepidiphilum]|nr:FtsX-like permease family protein [Cryobacterium tepidiphilum]
MTGFLDDAATTGTRAIIASAPARDRAMQVQLRSADQATTDAVGAALEAGLACTRAALLPSTRSRPIPLLAPAESQPAAVIVGADPGLAEHATLVDGSWPEPLIGSDSGTGAPVPAALQADAADALGVAVGDTIGAGWPGKTARFRITATWRPTDPSAASWFGDPAAATGFDHDAVGPLLVGGAWPHQLSSVLGAPTARWTLTPSAAITPDALPVLAKAIGGLQETGVPGVDAVSVTGDLDQTLARVQHGLVIARAIAAIPALLVVLLALITLGRLAGLVASARRSETSLRAARGASVAALAAFHTGEAALVAVPAAAIGSLAAALALGAAGVTASPSVLPIAAGVATGAVATAAVVAWRGIRGAVRVTRGTESGRARAAATAGMTLLVAGAAALSLRQFLLYRSPLTAGPDGSVHLDPLAALAPALCLVALALVGLLCFGPLLRSLQSVTTRSRGLAVVLPARQVARRPGVFAVALLLVTLAAGAATVAAGFTATWAALDQGAGLTRNGSDVRVQLDADRTAGGPGTLVTAVPYASLPQVDAALPVLAAPGRIATDAVSVLALRSDALASIAPALPPALRDASVAGRLMPASVGSELAGTRLSTTLTVDPVAGAGPGARVDVFSWVVDADGALTRLPLGRVALDSGAPVELSTMLPTGRAPWRLLAFEATRADVGTSAPVQVHFRTAKVGPAALHTATATWNHPTGRVMTGAGEAEPLPVVLTDELARRLGAQPGATLSFLLPGSGATVDAVVAGTAPYLPGTVDDDAILADLRMLDDHLLRAGDIPPPAADIWLSTDAPADVAGEAALLPHVAAAVSTADTGSTRALLAPVVTALWWGVAGILVLAVVAVVSTTVSLADSRRGEVVLLRTLGLTAGAQVRSRLAELGVVVAGAFVLGGAAGAVVTLLTVPDLARTAVGDPGAAIPVPLLVAWPAWGASLGALAVLLAAAGLGYAARIRRQAADTAWREETR